MDSYFRNFDSMVRITEHSGHATVRCWQQEHGSCAKLVFRIGLQELPDFLKDVRKFWTEI